jgi:hypothetical protein
MLSLGFACFAATLGRKGWGACEAMRRRLRPPSIPTFLMKNKGQNNKINQKFI